jgi:hypothetical protein
MRFLKKLEYTNSTAVSQYSPARGKAHSPILEPEACLMLFDAFYVAAMSIMAIKVHLN